MQTKLTYTDLLDLLQEIATKSKYIDDSCEIQNDDSEMFLTNSGSKTVMLMTDPKELITEGSGVRSNQNIEFMIVKYRNTKAAQVPLVRDIKEDCRKITLKVLSYLRNQMRLGNLSNFSVKMPIEPVDILNLNWHGYKAKIEINCPIDISFNADDWE